MKPSQLLIGLLAALLAIALALGCLNAFGLKQALLEQVLSAALLALATFAALDAAQLWRITLPRITRQIAARLPQNRWCEVQLSIDHNFPQALYVDVFDYLPQGMDYQHLPLKVRLEPDQLSLVSYKVRALQRGQFDWSICELLLPSPWRLWQRRCRLPCASSTRVYPNFAQLYQHELMAEHDWLNNLGVRLKPRRGIGQEFHQLREFRDGDSLRQIDWKATARKRTPIAREYQDERDQQVIFLLDCSRRMRSQDGDLSHFDHALNSLLLLSHVALRQGDAVGLCTFASEPLRFLAPAKGTPQLNALLNQLYDLHSSTHTADYQQAIDELLRRQKRRALVVLITNLRDEDEQSLPSALQQLNRKHRVLVANLRESILDQLRQEPVHSYQQAVDYCGAVEYSNARQQLNERLHSLNITLLESSPEQLGAKLINRYLQWKKTGVL